ncbi:glycosyltransferase family 39 protein [Streptomyces sp. NPDC006739]|uniref:glycosyltransferase family 39 protein n=1 Tax=Streptomyces sp. NPDC006739 TaxID=3364763 RepID=UPI0036A3A945
MSRPSEAGPRGPAEAPAELLAPSPHGRTWARSVVEIVARPAVAVGLATAGIVLLALVGAGAPNDHTLNTRIGPGWPGMLPGIGSTVLVYPALVLSSLGLAGMLAACGRGWRPSPRRLFGAGLVAVLVVVNLTPVGSSDVASYAAYGRIAALGGDPYTTTPDELGGTYADLVGSAWRHAPSVYGPVATWFQEAAAMVGGSEARTTIWLLMLANGAMFLATGYVLLRISDDPVRAALMWVANPLLIVLLVGGGHLDTVVAALAACTVHCARRSGRPRQDVLVGVLAGLACGVKISAVLVGAALVGALLLRHRWRAAARTAGAGVLTLVVLYGRNWPHVAQSLSSASSMVSSPSLWATLRPLGEAVFGPRGTSAVITVVWPVLTVALARWLHGRFPPGAPSFRTMPFALSFAWVLVAPWSMPWYGATAWATAAQFLRGPLLRWLLLTTTALAMVHMNGGHAWSG